VAVAVTVDVCDVVAEDVTVVSQPPRLKGWDAFSRYAVTSEFNASTVTLHELFGVRRIPSKISTVVPVACENSLVAREASETLASRGRDTRRPPSAVPSLSLRARQLFISFPKSP
jgi:hypothetical protein